MATITNYEQGDRDIHVNDLNPHGFPPDATLFVNDLEGTCAGILALNETDQLGSFYTPLWVSEGGVPKILTTKPSLVLAMGTGLGTALIVTDFTKQSHHIFPMEAGHILITELGVGNVDYEKEREMIKFIGGILYQDSFTIEFEDVCSGRGIGYVYRWLTGEEVSTGDIVEKAENGDEMAKSAIGYVYRFLIRNAQNACIFSQAKNVFLSGDNQVKNYQFVEPIKDMLHQEFLNHPKGQWLESVDMWAQTTEANFNIFGALFLSRKYNNQS